MRLLVLLVLAVVCGPAVPAWADEWRWPLDGPAAVSRPFVAPAHRYAAGHRGADLPSAPGAPVRAAGGGWVSYAGLVAGRGVVVVVHGDLRTTYEPVTALVGLGDVVVAGEVLGSLEPGHAGCPVLACLHWGLRRGEDYLDPVRLVEPGPVRLLPLAGTGAGPLAGGAGRGSLREAGVVPVAPARAPERPAARADPVLAPRTGGLPAAAAVPGSTTTALAASAAAAVLGAAGAGARLRRRSDRRGPAGRPARGP